MNLPCCTQECPCQNLGQDITWLPWSQFTRAHVHVYIHKHTKKTMQISWISEWLGVMQVNPHLHPVLLGESAELKQVNCKCHITNVGNTQLIKITNLTHCSWLAWRTSISQEPKENVDLVDREHFSTAFRENLATNLQVGVKKKWGKKGAKICDYI